MGMTDPAKQFVHKHEQEKHAHQQLLNQPGPGGYLPQTPPRLPAFNLQAPWHPIQLPPCQLNYACHV